MIPVQGESFFVASSPGLAHHLFSYITIYDILFMVFLLLFTFSVLKL